MKDLYKLIGRIGFSAVILVFGVMHFMKTTMMLGMVPKWLPFDAAIWVYLFGAIMIITAVLIVWDKKYPTIAALVLAGVLMSYVLFIHLSGAIDGNMASISSMLKDIGLAAGALLCASIASD